MSSRELTPLDGSEVVPVHANQISGMPIDFRSPDFNLDEVVAETSELADFRKNTLAFYRKLDSEIDTLLSDETAAQNESLINAALRQNFALKTTANHALVQSIFAEYRFGMCHPDLEVPESIQPYNPPSDLSEEKQYKYIEAEERFDEYYARSGTPLNGTGARLLQMLRTVNLIDLPTYAPIESALPGIMPRPVWVVGTRPSAENPDETDYIAAAINHHLHPGINNYNGSDYTGFNYRYSYPVHSESHNGFIAATDLPPEDSNKHSPELSNLVENVRLRERNTFGFITFTGPDDLPDPYFSADADDNSSILSLQDWNRKYGYDIRPQAVAEKSGPAGVAHVHDVGRAVLTDTVLFDYAVPDHLARLAQSLDLGDTFVRRSTLWRQQRAAIDDFTHQNTTWGDSPIPYSYDPE